MADKYELTIDGREPPSVFSSFDLKSVPYTRSNLDAGDFRLSCGDKIVVLAERKTWGDLCGSISSGHLAEQLARMIQQSKVANARPMLILECDRVTSHEGYTGG
jgi:ERCC4-type nuclease